MRVLRENRVSDDVLFGFQIDILPVVDIDFESWLFAAAAGKEQCKGAEDNGKDRPLDQTCWICDGFHLSRRLLSNPTHSFIAANTIKSKMFKQIDGRKNLQDSKDELR